MGTRTKLAKGIYEDAYGIEVVIMRNGHRASQRFRCGTPLAVMQAWRQRTELNLRMIDRMPSRPFPAESAPNGWCYIYFFRSGDAVRIGQTGKAVRERQRNLQQGNDQRLELVGVLPGHKVIEAAIHDRFAKDRREGDWFTLTNDLIEFIGLINDGWNPIALLWTHADQPIANPPSLHDVTLMRLASRSRHRSGAQV